jgi:hypothetical protein
MIAQLLDQIGGRTVNVAPWVRFERDHDVPHEGLDARGDAEGIAGHVADPGGAS